MSSVIYIANKEKGFWDNDRNVGELLMLVNTELSEAMQGHQKGKFTNPRDLNHIKGLKTLDDFKSQFKAVIKDTFEDEIADAIIRLLDMCGGLRIDIQKHIELKLLYNHTRPRLHGNKY